MFSIGNLYKDTDKLDKGDTKVWILGGFIYMG